MQDAWRAYLELALGLTEASRKRAQTAVARVIGSGGATAAQLQAMAEELFSTGIANREALNRIIRVEVDRTLAAVGLATAEEVAELTARIDRLERELRRTTAGTAPATGQPATGQATDDVTPTAGKAVAKNAEADKAVARKTVAKKTVKKAVAKKAVAAKRPSVEP